MLGEYKSKESKAHNHTSQGRSQTQNYQKDK